MVYWDFPKKPGGHLWDAETAAGDGRVDQCGYSAWCGVPGVMVVVVVRGNGWGTRVMVVMGPYSWFILRKN